MEINEVRQLAEILRETGLESLELKDGEFSLKLNRPAAYAGAEAQGPGEAGVTAAPPLKSEAKAPGVEVISPVVGVFYSASAPGEAPFVSLGSAVKKGDVLCIVEAMKMMNEITAEMDGTVAEICAENGEVVEYAQPLFRIA